MGNFKQVIVGAGLLTAAFFVGSHFRGDPVDPNELQSAESLADEDLIWHSGEVTAEASAVPSVDSADSAQGNWGAPPLRTAPATIAAPLPVDRDSSRPTDSTRQAMPSFANEQVDSSLAQIPEFNLSGSQSEGVQSPFPSRDGATAPSLARIQGDSIDSFPNAGSGVPARSGSYQTPAVSGLAPLVGRQQRQIQLVVDSFQLHQVRPGESLTTIAQQYYGSPDYYLDVYLANQDVMSNPASLPEGATIKIPVLRRDR